MLDIPSISAVVTTIGVLVGVTLGYLEIRTLVKQNQTELLMGIFSSFSTKESWESWEKIRDRKTMSYGDYKKKIWFGRGKPGNFVL